MLNRTIAGLLGPTLAAIAIGGGLWIHLAKGGSGPERGAAVLPEGDRGWSVVAVHDGDTLRAARDGEERKIRLCGVDAPELAQPGGIEARDRLRELLPDGEPIAIVEVDTDKYGRAVAEVFAGDRHINSQLAAEGLAWSYSKYISNCPNKQAILLGEARAKQARIGIWAEEGAIAPWEWRRSK